MRIGEIFIIEIDQPLNDPEVIVIAMPTTDPDAIPIEIPGIEVEKEKVERGES
jgi:hypothetical protein